MTDRQKANGFKRDESTDDVQQFGECVCCGHRGGIAARLYDYKGENPIGMCGECYRACEFVEGNVSQEGQP